MPYTHKEHIRDLVQTTFRCRVVRPGGRLRELPHQADWRGYQPAFGSDAELMAELSPELDTISIYCLHTGIYIPGRQSSLFWPKSRGITSQEDEALNLVVLVLTTLLRGRHSITRTRSFPRCQSNARTVSGLPAFRHSLLPVIETN